MAKTAIRLKFTDFRGQDVRIHQNSRWNRPFSSKSRILWSGTHNWFGFSGEPRFGRDVRICQNPLWKRPPGSKSHILGVGMSEFVKTHGENGHSAQNHGFQGSGCQNSSKLTVKPAIRLKLSQFRGRDVRICQHPWWKRPFGSNSRILGVGMSEFVNTYGENGHPAQNPTF